MNPMRFIKWFYPGMRVKRWFIIGVAGLIFFGIGAALLPIESGLMVRLMSLVLVVGGLSFVLWALAGILRSLLEVVSPSSENQTLVDLVFQRRHLERGPRLVAIGGGTGISTLLSGLKQYTTNITAIVTVSDDGGSSGRLREEFDMLPPGDIRNCLVALADSEPLVQRLFQYRFAEDSVLKGHNFGNLFITAMTKITGDFERAVKASSKVLAIRGRVVPSTNTKVRLVAEHDDGSVTVGESKISRALNPVRRVYLEPSVVPPSLDALEAIREADAIILGPGSLYTSIIPNLLVEQVADAIVQSRALKIYVCNVMTQERETANFKASDHVRALVAHASPGILQACIVNTRPVPEELLERYRAEEAFPVEADVDRIHAMGYRVVTEDIISTEDFVRHDSEKLGKVIIQLVLSPRKTAATTRPGPVHG